MKRKTGSKFYNIRELVLEILMRVNTEKAYLNILLPNYFNQSLIKREDKALMQEISYGVTRFRKKLDWIIDQFLNSRNKKLPLILRNVLRMGVYQMIHLNRIPDYAICNESVELVKNSQYSGYSSLINAVLRNINRNLQNIHWPDIHKNPLQYVSNYYSFPEVLVERWIGRFGLDTCICICQASNQKPGITIRMNPLKTTMPQLKNSLSEMGINFSNGSHTPAESLIIKDFFDISHSIIFRKGLISIQDESSMLASMFLNPSEEDTVIDMCSGPGGKTIHLAQLMHNQGKIIAFEKHPQRLQLVREECQRLGIINVKPILSDSSHFSEDFLEVADKIMVDVPCSGTGVIRKKPDLKWNHFDIKQIKQLNQLQEAILYVASRYLKPGGEMLYSTCSIEKEENDQIIQKFLKKNPGFSVTESSRFVQKRKLIKYQTEISQAIQLLPGYSGEDIDGFFMVKLKKNR